MFFVESESGETGTGALVRLPDTKDGDSLCIVAASRLLPSTSSQQLSKAFIYYDIRENINSKYVLHAWIDARAGITFVELTPDGCEWALHESNDKSFPILPYMTGLRMLTHVSVNREGPKLSQSKQEVRVSEVLSSKGELHLSEATSEGMLLGEDGEIIAFVSGNNSTTAVLLDNFFNDFLHDRDWLFK